MIEENGGRSVKLLARRRTWLLTTAFCLLLSAPPPHFAAAPPAPVAPAPAVTVRTAIPTPQPVEQVVPVGEVAEIAVTGLTAETARLVDVVIWPRPKGLWIRKVADWDGTGFVILLRSPVSGEFLIHVASNGATANAPVQAAEVIVTIGEPQPPVGAPVITSTLSSVGSVGVAYSYAVTATGSPDSYAATGLLEGLSLDARTGVIAGTPTAAGTSSVRLAASNAAGTGTATLALTISDKPPEPPEPPTPVARKCQIIVIEETEDSTAEWSRVRNSAAIRAWAEKGQHFIAFLDKDSPYTGPNENHWKFYQDKAKTVGLPALFVAPIEGGALLYEAKAPATEAGFLSLVQRFGGVGASNRSPLTQGTVK